MPTRLPPLNALRTFEAAARHLSFTKAAEELFVTQAAVSHQIRSLEDHLGMQLFRRFNRRLMLTDQGQLLLPSVRQAFDALLAGVDLLGAHCRAGTLIFSTTPSFAGNWLVGRLSRFQALYPEIELQISATSRLVDFAREAIDCGVRHGFGDWPGLRAERLFSEQIFPVCSPSLLEGSKPLRHPEDVRHHTLLHVLDDMDDWRLWLQAAGVQSIDPTRGPKFDSGPLAIQAAIGGAGIALGRTPMVAEDLAAGRLVEPLEFALAVESAYHFVAPEATWELEKIAIFRDWLRAETQLGTVTPAASS